MKDSLEFRLERIKRLGNLHFELLECFYNGRSIAERYVDGDVLLHVHGLASDYRFCATFGKRDVDWEANNCETLVFVWVGDIPEYLWLVQQHLHHLRTQ